MSSITDSIFADESVKLVVHSGDLMRILELDRDAGGNKSFDKCLSLFESVLDLQRKRVSAQSAMVRSTSSNGSRGSSSSRALSPGAGLTGTRLASIAKIESWRGKGDTSLSGCEGGLVGSPSLVPDGMCYMKMLAKGSLALAQKVGSWPTFGSLVRLSSKAFKSLDQLERFRLVSRGEGLYHIAAGGKSGVSFLDAVTTYALRAKVQDGTLAFAARHRQLSEPVVVDGRHRVGGDVPSGGGLFSEGSSAYAGLFGARQGVSVGSVCPTPFFSDAVAFSSKEITHSDLGCLMAAGFRSVSTTRLRVDGVMLYVVYLLSDLSLFELSRSRAAAALVEFESSTGARVVRASAFESLNALNVAIV